MDGQVHDKKATISRSVGSEGIRQSRPIQANGQILVHTLIDFHHLTLKGL